MPTDWSEPITILDYPVFTFLLCLSIIVAELAASFISLNIYNWWAHYWKKNKIKVSNFIQFFLLKKLRIAKIYKVNDGKTSRLVIISFLGYLVLWFGIICSFMVIYLYHIFQPSILVEDAFNVWIIFMIAFHHAQWIAIMAQSVTIINSYNRDYPALGKICFKRIKNNYNYFNVITTITKKASPQDMYDVFLTIMDFDSIKEVKIFFENHGNEFREIEVELEIEQFSKNKSKKDFFNTIWLTMWSSNISFMSCPIFSFSCVFCRVIKC